MILAPITVASWVPRYCALWLEDTDLLYDRLQLQTPSDLLLSPSCVRLTWRREHRFCLALGMVHFVSLLWDSGTKLSTSYQESEPQRCLFFWSSVALHTGSAVLKHSELLEGFGRPRLTV